MPQVQPTGLTFIGEGPMKRGDHYDEEGEWDDTEHATDILTETVTKTEKGALAVTETKTATSTQMHSVTMSGKPAASTVTKTEKGTLAVTETKTKTSTQMHTVTMSGKPATSTSTVLIDAARSTAISSGTVTVTSTKFVSGACSFGLVTVTSTPGARIVTIKGTATSKPASPQLIDLDDARELMEDQAHVTSALARVMSNGASVQSGIATLQGDSVMAAGASKFSILASSLSTGVSGDVQHLNRATGGASHMVSAPDGLVVFSFSLTIALGCLGLALAL